MMRMPSMQCRVPKLTEEGFALVTGLIFLVILLLLGMSIVSSTSTEEKIQRNSRDADVAFAAAEAALRDAELYISGAYKWPYTAARLSDFKSDCLGGLCDSTVTQAFQPVDQIDFFGATTPGSYSREIGATTSSPQIADVLAQPRYMVEMLCAQTTGDSVTVPNSGGCPKVFRITAKARGRLANTLVTLQEIYKTSNLSN